MSDIKKELNEEEIEQVSGGTDSESYDGPTTTSRWTDLMKKYGINGGDCDCHRGFLFKKWFKGLRPYDVSFEDGLRIFQEEYPALYEEARQLDLLDAF